MADDDDDVDLGISLEAVAAIVDHARALQGTEEAGTEPTGEDENSEAALREENPDDLTEGSLRAFIAELNEDEQASLIALAWTGSCTASPRWPSYAAAIACHSSPS